MTKRATSRKNLFGFGKKAAPKSKKRSSATIGDAMRAAFAAGKASGDTGLFQEWLESKGLDHRSETMQAKLRERYESGVEDLFVKRQGFKGPAFKRNKAIEMTMPIARAAAQDAGNRSMKKGGRTKWNDKDYNVASKEFSRLWDNRANPTSGKQVAIDALDASDAITGTIYDYTFGLPSKALRKLLTSKNPDRDELLAEARTSRNLEELARLHKYAIGHRDKELQAAVEKRAKDLGIRLSALTAAHPRKWNTRIASNPQDAADRMYEKFHGREPEEHVEVRERVNEHEWLATLGTLDEMVIDTETGLRASLTFDEKNPPWLCSTEDGTQLYVRGGDQSVDLAALKMDGKEWLKDRMVLGQFSAPEIGRGKDVRKHNLSYVTEKSFDNFEAICYQHDLGEETAVRPYLEYEPHAKLLYITGGQYRIELPMIGVSPGIEN